MILITIVSEKFLKLELLDFLFADASVHMTKDFDIPSAQSEGFHFFIRDN